MTALQWILNEAKKLKKQYPKRFSKWTDYVAQASAIYSSKHKGKSPVGKKKTSKRKKVSGVKDSALVKKELAKKGLKMPHGYATTKRKRKISGVHKKKISEQSILNRIHKVKEDVNALDEAQHKHMMSGAVGSMAIEKYKKTINDIANLEKALHRNMQKMKLYPYKTPTMQNWFKMTNKKIKSYIKELKIHAKELKKHI